jgi:hypothetical protein
LVYAAAPVTAGPGRSGGDRQAIFRPDIIREDGGGREMKVESCQGERIEEANRRAC